MQTAELFFSLWIHVEPTGCPLHCIPTARLPGLCIAFNPRHPEQGVCCLYKPGLYTCTLLSLHSQPRAWMDLVSAFSRESLHVRSGTQPKLAQKELSHQYGNLKDSAPCFLGKLKTWECCTVSAVRMLSEEQIPLHVSKIKATCGPRK